MTIDQLLKKKMNEDWEIFTTVCRLKNVRITDKIGDLIVAYLKRNKETVDLIRAAKRREARK